MTGYKRGVVRLRDRTRLATVDVLIPITDQTMKRGLVGFPCPEPDTGMVFLSQNYPVEEPIPMWISDVPCPLGLIWIRADGTVANRAVLTPGDFRTVRYRGIACLETDPALTESLHLPAQAELVLSDSG